MTPTRLPAEIRGDVPGLLVRGVPVACRDGSCPGVVSAVADESCCYIAETPPDHFTRRHDGYTKRSRFIDWSSPLALYAALHWLADRGHPCLWMLPTTHGGRVEAWDGLSAWEVSAVLVSHEVRLRATGRRGIKGAYRLRNRGTAGIRPGESAYDLVDFSLNGRGLFIGRGRDVRARAEAEMYSSALADGCALLVPGGIAVPE